MVDSEDAVSGVGAVGRQPRPMGSGEAAEGEVIRQLTDEGMEQPNGVAVSRATGQVVVADSAKGLVYVFGPSGSLESKFDGSGPPQGSFGKEEAEGNVSAVDVDELTGDIVVAEGERHVVSELNQPANGSVGSRTRRTACWANRVVSPSGRRRCIRERRARAGRGCVWRGGRGA